MYLGDDEKVCTWEKYEHSYLYGSNKKTITDQTYDKCQELCLTERRFKCKSFDYSYGSNICYLSINNMYSEYIHFHQFYDYYELNCLCK